MLKSFEFSTLCAKFLFQFLVKENWANVFSLTCQNSPSRALTNKMCSMNRIKIEIFFWITQGLQEKVLPRNLPHLFLTLPCRAATIFLLWRLLNTSHLSLYGWLCTRAMHRIQLLEVYREKETAEFSLGYKKYLSFLQHFNHSRFARKSLAKKIATSISHISWSCCPYISPLGLLNTSHLSLYGLLCTRAMHRIQLLEVYREKNPQNSVQEVKIISFWTNIGKCLSQSDFSLLSVNIQRTPSVTNQIKVHGKKISKEKEIQFFIICQFYKYPNMHFLRASFNLGG